MRILLVRLGALGDLVHLMPALDALRRANPDARISWVCEDRFAGLLRGHPQIDRLLEAPRRKGSWTAFLRALRSEPYDAAVELQGMTKGAWIVRASGAPRRIGYAPPLGKEGSHLWMTETVVIPSTPEAEHHTRKGILLMAGLGAKEAGAKPRFPRSAEAAAEAEKALGQRRGDPRVVLWPASSPGTRYRRWEPDRYVAVAEGLSADGCEVLVPESPGDEGLAVRIVGRLKGRARLLPFVPIPVLIEMLTRVDLVLGGDSGPAHLACSLGTPTVMIFGAKDPARYAPWGGPLAPLYHPVGCNPCRNTWCEHVTCLDRITPAEALSAARAFLFRRPAYTLRPAVEADFPFFRQLHHTVIRAPVEAIWGWDPELQARMARESFHPSRSRIVQLEGKDVGVLVVEDRPEELFLSSILLAEEYQGRGIGTAVIRDLAERAGKPLTLTVLRTNRAQALYRRMGFVETRRDENKVYMRLTAALARPS